MGSNLLSLAVIVGVVLGALLAISGFGDAARPTTFWDHPRVKNLLWALGGVGFLGILKPYQTKSAVDILDLMSRYGISLTMAFVICIALITALIVVDAECAKPNRAALRGNGLHLALQYVAYGFAKYNEAQKELLSTSTSALDKETLSKYGGLVSVAMGEAHGADRSDKPELERKIARALQSIEDIIRLFDGSGAELKLNSNYMVQVPRDKVGSLGLVKFLPKVNNERYVHFLALRSYQTGEQKEVYLAIEPADRQAALLPGAPTAYSKRQADIINCKTVKFARQVPTTTKKLVEEFFSREDYASVLCLPLLSGSNAIGVVNVESNRKDVVGADPKLIDQIIPAVTPICLVLAELISRHERLSQ
ncbi:MAG: hypothetical protein WDN06_10725 [Asticcacaulis sp.]